MKHMYNDPDEKVVLRDEIDGDVVITAARLIEIRPGCTIAGDLVCRATIAISVYLDGAVITGNVDCAGITVKGDFVCGAKIGGSFYLDGAVIGSGVYLDGATIAGSFNCVGATIDGILIGAPTPAEIALAKRIVDDIDAGALRFSMDSWHEEYEWRAAQPGDYCGTAHCIAGAAQCLSADPVIRAARPKDAGRWIAPNLSYLFYVSDALAERELRRIAAL